MSHLTRRQLRRLIKEEYYNATRQRSALNEGFAMGAFAVLAGAAVFAAAFGFQLLVFSTMMEKFVMIDPEIKAALSKLGEMQNKNPEMSPMEIIDLASQSDPALAAKVDELRRQYEKEYLIGSAGDNTGLF